MRNLAALFVFFLTVGLTFKTMAETAATGHKAAAPAGHGDHVSEMNSLFPEKKKNPKLAARPTVVELTGPKFLSQVNGGTAQLDWKEAKGANAYHLQVATDPNFKWLLIDEHFVKETSYKFTKAEPGQKYFWRVAAFNTENDSMFTKSNFSSSVFSAK